MSLNGWLQIVHLHCVGSAASRSRWAAYMTRVFERRRTWLDPVLVPVERLLYRADRIDADARDALDRVCRAMLIFSAATLLLTYARGAAAALLPLNPQHLPAVSRDLALNTAISFTTNTNWQAYMPETTMSYLTQMLGLATHNFWSAAVGMALAIAFIRGIARREMQDARQLLGRSHARHTVGACCPSRSSSRLCWSRRAWCRTFAPTTRRSCSSRSTVTGSGRQADAT